MGYTCGKRQCRFLMWAAILNGASAGTPRHAHAVRPKWSGIGVPRLRLPGPCEGESFACALAVAANWPA
eukprot:1156718-Pelagomonas_calceolata.AAC.8